MERIREIERIIDNYHIDHPVFKLPREQALFNVLRLFEDGCRLSTIARLEKTGNPNEALSFIREYLDALSVTVKWIYRQCQDITLDEIDFVLSEKDAYEALHLLHDYAMPYSAICCGYIAYSRGYFTAKVDDNTNTVTFKSTDKQKKMFCADIAETINSGNGTGFIPIEEDVTSDLISSIHFENKRICYSISDTIWNAFGAYPRAQWKCTRTLPDEWSFDCFSLEEYKETWIAITTLCYIHYFACLKSGTVGMANEDDVILVDEKQFCNTISQKSGVHENTVSRIMHYITYDPQIKNNDIIYQPIVGLCNDKVCIAPHLFLASRPERNLISLICKKKDTHYSLLSNTLEKTMQDEIDKQLDALNNIKIVHNIHLDASLPDVDYGIFDYQTNSAIICELKWLTETDSPQEVFAREEDIEHGCSQISSIMTYAIHDVPSFINKVFGIKSEFIDLFYCVVSKNNIRSITGNVPVISESKFIETLTKSQINNGFHAIRNYEFIESLPSECKIDSQPVEYAGYTFDIPALITYIP